VIALPGEVRRDGLLDALSSRASGVEALLGYDSSYDALHVVLDEGETRGDVSSGGVLDERSELKVGAA
jgi:hypothetical protein